MTTREKLTRALIAADAPERMVKLARAGEYDDFLSSSATPQTDLIRDCDIYHLPEIKQRVMDGEFDATREEAEAWFEQEGVHLLRGGRDADS